MRTVCWMVVVALWAAAGCSDGTGPASPGPGVRVVSGADARDSIYAPVREPLVVEVRDSSGRLATGIPVTFTPSAGATGGQSVWLAQQPTGNFGWGPVNTVTDAQGRAGVRVTLGRVAGDASVQISVPALGWQATARFTILPGRPLTVGVDPKDSAVYVGHNYALRPYGADREGNKVDTIATYAGATSGITVSQTGVVQGVSIGRERLIARVGGWSDTVWVSVVPTGTIAVHTWGGIVGASFGVVSIDLDGSNLRLLAAETPPRNYTQGEIAPGHEMPARWDPTAARITYHEDSARTSGYVGGFGIKHLLVCDVGGTPRRLFSTSPFITQQQPDYSPDGRWIYFSARAATEYYLDIWRAHPDGTGLERVTQPDETNKTRPSVSPDGRSLAYAAASYQSDPYIRVQDLVTGATHTVSAGPGTSPRWSPSGDRIAYVNSGDYSGYSGQLRVVQADGTADRLVTAAAAYGPVVDWSPDGRFLIAAHTGYGRLDLVDVSTGALLPLPYATWMSNPAWRR